MSEAITEEWLSETGFKSSQIERQPFPHWTLWIGEATPSLRHSGTSSSDGFGLEVSRYDEAGGVWMLWFRADYGGRYDRFLFARDVTTRQHLTNIIEAMTDRPFTPADVIFGHYRSREQAERMRQEFDRMDLRIAMARGDGS